MVGTVIGAVAPTVIGGLMGSDASSSAANTQSQGAADALALQRQVYNETVARNAPYLTTGTAANNRLGFLLGLNPTSSDAESIYNLGYKDPYTAAFREAEKAGSDSLNTAGADSATPYKTIAQMLGYQDAFQKDFGSTQAWLQQNFGTTNMDALLKAYANKKTGLTEPGAIPDPNAAGVNDPAFGSLARSFSMNDFEQDPGYAFRVSEGQKALERSAAARGTSLGGAQQKALTRYGQDMGSQEYSAAYNRFNTNQGNLFSRLSSLANSGQSAANNTSSAGQNYATNGGNLITGSAQAQANNATQQGNIWGDVGSKVGSSIGDIFKQTSSSGLPYADIINANPSIF